MPAGINGINFVSIEPCVDDILTSLEGRSRGESVSPDYSAPNTPVSRYGSRQANNTGAGLTRAKSTRATALIGQTSAADTIQTGETQSSTALTCSSNGSTTDKDGTYIGNDDSLNATAGCSSENSGAQHEQEWQQSGWSNRFFQMVKNNDSLQCISLTSPHSTANASQGSSSLQGSFQFDSTCDNSQCGSPKLIVNLDDSTSSSGRSSTGLSEAGSPGSSKHSSRSSTYSKRRLLKATLSKKHGYSLVGGGSTRDMIGSTGSGMHAAQVCSTHQTVVQAISLLERGDSITLEGGTAVMLSNDSYLAVDCASQFSCSGSSMAAAGAAVRALVVASKVPLLEEQLQARAKLSQLKAQLGIAAVKALPAVSKHSPKTVQRWQAGALLGNLLVKDEMINHALQAAPAAAPQHLVALRMLSDSFSEKCDSNSR